MRIAVIGVGGVGGYFGARLAQAGEEVTFIARGDMCPRSAGERPAGRERGWRHAHGPRPGDR